MYLYFCYLWREVKNTEKTKLWKLGSESKGFKYSFKDSNKQLISLQLIALEWNKIKNKQTKPELISSSPPSSPTARQEKESHSKQLRISFTECAALPGGQLVYSICPSICVYWTQKGVILKSSKVIYNAGVYYASIKWDDRCNRLWN